MLGIENIKRLLKAGLTFGKNAGKAFEDKKISFFEAIGLLPEVFALIGVAKTWTDVQAELSDLDEAEKEEINLFVSDEFSIPNEKVELFIEHALMQIISLNVLLNEFKQLKNEDE